MDVQHNNMTQLSANYKRIVNNVTMAMPHSGVLDAARDPRNGIVQPQDLSVSPSEKYHYNDMLIIPCCYRDLVSILYRLRCLLRWSTSYVQSCPLRS